MIRRLLIAGAISVTALAIAAARLPNMAAPPGLLASNVLGQRPHYGPERVAEVPNETAITRRFWVPGLDDGYDPQGLALAEGGILVSAYRSEGLNVHRGPCRVFRIEPERGNETGRIDVPPPCGHAGGVAEGGDGNLYVADTHALLVTLLHQAFSGRPLPFRGIALGDGVIGALAVSAPGAIWLGTYREKEPGRLYRFASQILERAAADGLTLTVADASAQIVIPTYAQGAAFDRGGRLWVARSDDRWGELDLINPANGAVERRYAMAPGIEGIAFDPDGRLWAVSEAGAKHVYDSFFARLVTPFFPLVYAIDVAKLE